MWPEFELTDRVELASSRASNMLIEEDTLGFDWGKGPKSYPEKCPLCRRFSTDALTERPEATGCWKRHLDFHQSSFSRVVTLILLGARPICLGGPTRNQSFRQHSSDTNRCHRPATLRRDWILKTACHASQSYSIWNQKNSLEKSKCFFQDINPWLHRFHTKRKDGAITTSIWSP